MTQHICCVIHSQRGLYTRRLGVAGLAPDDVNRPATELLLAATRFTAPTVPLMRGRIVLTSHDSSGNPAGLEDWSARRAILIGTLRWAYHVVLQRNTGHHTGKAAYSIPSYSARYAARIGRDVAGEWH
jgi:hypothetical protein